MKTITIKELWLKQIDRTLTMLQNTQQVEDEATLLTC